MKKPTAQMVWPQENYTDLVHQAILKSFRESPYVTFTVDQLKQSIQAKCPWLTLDTERRQLVLRELIKTGTKKFIQEGLVVEVESKMSTERQWKFRTNDPESGWKCLTSQDEVAQSDIALKTLISLNRAVSKSTLRKLNRA